MTSEVRCLKCEALITELDCQDCLAAAGYKQLRDNIQVRRSSPKRAEKCRNGHTLTKDNTRTRTRKRGDLTTTHTECVTCKREKEKRQRKSQEYIDRRKKKRRTYA